MFDPAGVLDLVKRMGGEGVLEADTVADAVMGV